MSSEQQIEDNTEIIDNSHENCPLQISRNKEKDCSSNISQRNDFFLKQNEQDMIGKIEISANNVDSEGILILTYSMYYF